MRALVLASVLAIVSLTVAPISVAPMPSHLYASFVGSGRTLVDTSADLGHLTKGEITGNISIANIAPLCYYGGGTVANPEPVNDNTTVVVTNESGRETFISVNWVIVAGCQLIGTFHALLDPGSYQLTLSYCLAPSTGQFQPPGCPHALCGVQSCNLPVTIDVKAGKLTPISIGITTGIY